MNDAPSTLAAEIPRYLLVFGCVLVASLLLTPLVRRLGLRYGWTGKPQARYIHTQPIPRVGGVAIYLAFMLGLALTYFLIPGSPYPSWADPFPFAFLALGATIIEAVMLWDDIRGMRAVPKLIWQLVAVAVIVLPTINWGALAVIYPPWERYGIIANEVNSPFGGLLVLPALLAVGFTFFWIVGMMNAINWSDGLDGLAGGITLVSSVILLAVSLVPRPGWTPQITVAYLPLILAAAVLGFLPYNWHPARIFMGDSGAMFLGFALAVIAIIGGAKIATALLVLGLPILDVAYVIIYRLMRGRSPLEADRAHLHYRLYDLGLSQRQIVIIYLLLCLFFGGLSFLPSSFYKLIALSLMAIILLVFLLVITRREFDRGRPAPAESE